MAMLRLLMSLVAIAMVFGSAMATDYTVGSPNGGWDQSSDLPSWAASHTFFVGDTIIFEYAPSHTVLEVTKADYDSCETTNAISVNAGGKTVITLTSVGKRYFICGSGGHCSTGMKLEVNTVAKASPPPPAKPATPPTATPTTPPPSTTTTPAPSTPTTPPPSTPTTPAPSTPTTPPPSTPTKSPASAPSTTPVAPTPSSSPSPKSSSAPSPKHAPKTSPAMSPSKSPQTDSPAMSPASIPTSPAVEAPGLPPSGVSAPAPSPPLSAAKITVVAGSTMGFGFVAMMLFLL